jgi:hypothetical protein
MFIFVVKTLQIKWNKICMKQLARGKHMENDCFPRTLKFKMYGSIINFYVESFGASACLVLFFPPDNPLILSS